jgi:hypothetical protein
MAVCSFSVLRILNPKKSHFIKILISTFVFNKILLYVCSSFLYKTITRVAFGQFPLEKSLLRLKSFELKLFLQLFPWTHLLFVFFLHLFIEISFIDLVLNGKTKLRQDSFQLPVDQHQRRSLLWIQKIIYRLICKYLTLFFVNWKSQFSLFQISNFVCSNHFKDLSFKIDFSHYHSQKSN